MLRNKLTIALLLCSFLIPSIALAQGSANGNTAAPKEAIDKIKDEGANHSQIMPTLSYLSDVIGPRLTGSPAMKRANDWTRDLMAKWGLENAHLEAWGPFGRGWTLKHFTAEVTSPNTIPITAYPKAWSPSTNGRITSDVVYFAAETSADFEKYRGQLKGKIVFINKPRRLSADFTGMARRLTSDDLLKLANAPDPSQQSAANAIPPQMLKMYIDRFVESSRRTDFLVREGAALLIDNSPSGSGGTIFVTDASVAQEFPNNVTVSDLAAARVAPWQKQAESKLIPQMTMATEQYNRLVSMINKGEKLRISADIQAEYDDRDAMAYNTIAEIPGTDPLLKNEVVMIGAHLDSWHAGTGATDNGAGVVVAMEAMRIIKSLGLKPRRTIRIGLWSGEEEGIFGSRAYVSQHFGEMRNAAPTAAFGMGGDPGTLSKKADYDTLSAYYNLDDGTGKIRGVYVEGNSAAKPIFEQWLAPFADAGAATLSLASAGTSDHMSFDIIGLPGFQFLQDPIEYETRTHHSSQDVLDRIQLDDLKQAATIMAAFVYQTAVMDQKIPRKGSPRVSN